MKYLFLFTAMAALAACATPVPIYQPAQTENALGYRDYPIESNRYRISYRSSSEEAADRFALRRAAQLTANNGYDWFEIVNRSAEMNTNASSGSRVSIGGGTGSYGSGVSLGGGIGLGLGTASSGNTLVRLEVVMGAGPRPDRPNTYEADAVLANISG
ncbi:CC0125/CC1285 family lipoprotein [Aquisalinus flavus]|uniref:Lipoprotein n=1 Tax=Aquisalinus flavus TaxID=1526572 RepID=A0A8J2Y722_9PROT|nr:hypothetical protein [Aquisalinus flavus]MBD0425252.1 hypothetical protein [Aquisalinus flavus]UNE49091.1 hypothetical protein FF099_14035 [Aquisalinus flavus]GGD17541.1 hypothetical protein GCM10011342_27930 [Aquisalinus flavus]